MNLVVNVVNGWVSMEETRQLSFNNKTKKSLSALIDIKLLSTSLIAVIAYIFYQFGYSFLYGFYFVDEPINVIRIISNPIPFDFKAVVAIGSISFVCLATFVFANLYLRDQPHKIIVKIMEYLLPILYALSIYTIIGLVSKPKNLVALLIQLTSYSYALNSAYTLVYSIKQKRSPLIITSILWAIILIILSIGTFNVKMTTITLFIIWNTSVAFEDILYSISETLTKNDKAKLAHMDCDKTGKRSALLIISCKFSTIMKLPLKFKLKGFCLILVNYFKFFPIYFLFEVIIANILVGRSIHLFIQQHLYVYTIICTVIFHIFFCLLCYGWNYIYKRVMLKINENKKNNIYGNSYKKYSKRNINKVFEGLLWFILPIYAIICLISIYYFMGQLGHFMGKNSLNDNICLITYSTINGSENNVYGNIIAQDSHFYYIMGIPDQKLYTIKATHINSIPTNNQAITKEIIISNSIENTSRSIKDNSDDEKIKEKVMILIDNKIYIKVSDFFDIFSEFIMEDTKGDVINYSINGIKYTFCSNDETIKMGNEEINLNSMLITYNEISIIPLQDVIELMGFSIEKNDNNSLVISE